MKTTTGIARIRSSVRTLGAFRRSRWSFDRGVLPVTGPSLGERRGGSPGREGRRPYFLTAAGPALYAAIVLMRFPSKETRSSLMYRIPPSNVLDGVERIDDPHPFRT